MPPFSVTLLGSVLEIFQPNRMCQPLQDYNLIDLYQNGVIIQTCIQQAPSCYLYSIQGSGKGPQFQQPWVSIRFYITEFLAHDVIFN